MEQEGREVGQKEEEEEEREEEKEKVQVRQKPTVGLRGQVGDSPRITDCKL